MFVQLGVLQISNKVVIPDNEIEIHATHAQGHGGQNVNKVATAIHLRFDINNSSLPEAYKKRLLKLHDHRISKEGVIIIKAQETRSQNKNKLAALNRLREIIDKAGITPKKRIPTQPTKSSGQKRLDTKTRRGRIKDLRKKIVS